MKKIKTKLLPIRRKTNVITMTFPQLSDRIILLGKNFIVKSIELRNGEFIINYIYKN